LGEKQLKHVAILRDHANNVSIITKKEILGQEVVWFCRSPQQSSNNIIKVGICPSYSKENVRLPDSLTILTGI